VIFWKSRQAPLLPIEQQKPLISSVKLQISGRVKFTAEKVKFVQFDSTGMGPIGGTSVPLPEGGV